MSLLDQSLSAVAERPQSAANALFSHYWQTVSNTVEKHSTEAVVAGIGVLSLAAAVKFGRPALAEIAGKEALSLIKDTAAREIAPASEVTGQLANRFRFSGSHIVAAIASSEKDQAIADLPEMWLPKRSFASVPELMKEASFPGIERVELASPVSVDNFVRQIRSPMAGWQEDLVREGKFKRSLNYMMMRGSVGGKDFETAAIVERRAADIDRSLNTFSRHNRLAQVPVIVPDSDLDGIYGAVDSTNGKMLIPDASLMVATDSESASEFVGVVAHEYNHGIQLNLMLRQIASEMGVTSPTEKALIQVGERYTKLTGSPIEEDLLKRALSSDALRVPISRTQAERAEWLLTGWGKSQPNGMMLPTVYFRGVRNHLLDLTGPMAEHTATGLLRCGEDASFAEINFGAAELTPRLSYLRSSIVEQGRTDMLPQAIKELKPILTESLNRLNLQKQAAYATYMQPHEQESLVVGELARLRSQELGAL